MKSIVNDAKTINTVIETRFGRKISVKPDGENAFLVVEETLSAERSNISSFLTREECMTLSVAFAAVAMGHHE